ncbi:ribbon-helix-helix protein, CopG family [Dactylosporangium sp. NPDC050688]|uniref:ribbon-helix-helix protein, CopG family n=1 Tax=Dactylosporangium sp. NPDC050688 TaxID=3157217 RepID=UPI0033FEB14C
MTERDLPNTPDEARALMDNLTFDQPLSAEEEQAVLAGLPPRGAEVMVVRSLRLPVDVDEAVAAAARDAGIPKSTWIRQAIEAALALQGDDQPISRADALRALTLLRSAHRAA